MNLKTFNHLIENKQYPLARFKRSTFSMRMQDTFRIFAGTPDTVGIVDILLLPVLFYYGGAFSLLLSPKLLRLGGLFLKAVKDSLNQDITPLFSVLSATLFLFSFCTRLPVLIAAGLLTIALLPIIALTHVSCFLINRTKFKNVENAFQRKDQVWDNDLLIAKLVGQQEDTLQIFTESGPYVDPDNEHPHLLVFSQALENKNATLLKDMLALNVADIANDQIIRYKINKMPTTIS